MLSVALQTAQPIIVGPKWPTRRIALGIGQHALRVPIGWRIAFADVTLAAKPSNLAELRPNYGDTH